MIFQHIGKWSYSIYLWHWPIAVYGYYKSYNWYLIGIPLSIFLGGLSYRFIESVRFQRVEHWNQIYRVRQLWFTCIASFFSVMIFYMNGFDIPYREAANSEEAKFFDKYKKYTVDHTGLFVKCNASLQMEYTGKAQVADVCISNNKGGVFLWGDSHMGSISMGLRDNLSKGVPFSQLTSSGCSPSFSIKRNGTNRFDVGCDYSNSVAYDAIIKTEPKVVILGARENHNKNDWLKTVDTLTGLGVKKVVILGPLPQWLKPLPLIYIKKYFGKEFIQDESFDVSTIKNNDYLKKISNSSFVFIDVLDSLCKRGHDDKLSCRVLIGDELIAFDYGHLTPDASNFIVKNYLVKQVNKALKL